VWVCVCVCVGVCVWVCWGTIMQLKFLKRERTFMTNCPRKTVVFRFPRFALLSWSEQHVEEDKCGTLV